MGNVLIKLSGSTTRYFQLLIRSAFHHKTIPEEVACYYIKQIVLQVPDDAMRLRTADDFVVRLYISEEDLLTLLATEADIYAIDDLNIPVGALLFVQAQKAIKLPDEGEGGEDNEELGRLWQNEPSARPPRRRNRTND